ncbi:uncharacterized protein SAPINGB_P002850 [Magnusiomyces paraingens]|uniref:TFIIS N-terminal domain-containing protein n=1 Tax=Magnusiomyces paraingens TaxID=2606893 RepID=A0A5E8BJB1_9ASCO|nr:uncharacterized protein SAPINGB_P002850 [Saprochaete ingens]VVT50697.1 unnamed protein product [Saprochaete ingens]
MSESPKRKPEIVKKEEDELLRVKTEDANSDIEVDHVENMDDEEVNVTKIEEVDDPIQETEPVSKVEDEEDELPSKELISDHDDDLEESVPAEEEEEEEEEEEDSEKHAEDDHVEDDHEGNHEEDDHEEDDHEEDDHEKDDHEEDDHEEDDHAEKQSNQDEQNSPEPQDQEEEEEGEKEYPDDEDESHENEHAAGSDVDQNDSGSEKDIEEGVFKLKRHKKAISESRATAKSQLPVQKTRPPKHRTDDEELEAGRNGKRSKSSSAPAEENEGDNQDDGDSDGIVDDEPQDEETRRRKELKERIQNAGAKPKKKSRKANEESLDMYQDELVNQLRDQMRKAAIADAECVRNSQPAINKLKMLPKVTAVIRKGTMADTILDNNLLESIRIWLEPLPDASLPAYQIQKELFDALEALPIKTIHLRESGLGRVVLFYQRSKRPQLNIKRAVDRLIGNWTRPIMGRSDNYRDKRIRSSNYNLQNDDAYRKRSTAASQGAASQNSGDLSSANAVRRNRAMIPNSKPVYYEVAPKSVITQSAGKNRGGNNESYRRMTQKLLSKKTSSRKSGVSIEGR